LFAWPVGDLPEAVPKRPGVGSDDGLVVPVPVVVTFLRRVEGLPVQFDNKVVRLVEVVEEAESIRAPSLDLVRRRWKPVGTLNVAVPPQLEREVDPIAHVGQGVGYPGSP